ncbi:uncharacterized protein [Pyrus communis]|uniref:uncharacterized protein n=1 Tax=Pyrus communis TaxID=23211 RepID=UPI0035BED9D1
MAYQNMMNNYFNPNSVYNEEDFRSHFRMRCHVFEHQHVNPYFRQKLDRSGHSSFSPHQKFTIALQMLAYVSLTDAMGDTYGMSESTCLDNLTEYCYTIVQLYKEEYLHQPNQTDLDRLIRKAEDRGFMAMIGFQNDITVLGHLPLFNNLMEGKSPQLDYYVNGRQYNMRYYLADGIYPRWATLVQAIANPTNDTERWFTLHQEAYQKDVKRAFGILQAQWKIIKETAKGLSQENLNSIMMLCIILHNMIVEDDWDRYIDGEFDDDQEDPNKLRKARAKIHDGPNLPLSARPGNISLNEYMRCHRMTRSCATNKYLQQDLVAHL